MGLNISIQGANFTHFISTLIPAGENLAGHWSFSKGLTEGIKNKVTGVSGTLIGAPTVANGKIIADKANGFITDVNLGSEKTFIVIVKSTGTSIPLGSIDYDTAAGFNPSDSLMVYNSRPVIHLNGNIDVQAANTINLNTVHFIAGTLATTGNTLYVSSNGVLSKKVGGAHTGLSDPYNLRIGGWGVVSTTIVGTAEVYEALAFNKALSETEIQRVLDYFKNELAGTVIID